MNTTPIPLAFLRGKRRLHFRQQFLHVGWRSKATYRFSLSYLDEGGTTVGTGLNRLTSSLNIGYRFSDKLRVDADFTYSDSVRRTTGQRQSDRRRYVKCPTKAPIDRRCHRPANGEYFIRQKAKSFRGFQRLPNFHPSSWPTKVSTIPSRRRKR